MLINPKMNEQIRRKTTECQFCLHIKARRRSAVFGRLPDVGKICGYKRILSKSKGLFFDEPYWIRTQRMENSFDGRRNVERNCRMIYVGFEGELFVQIVVRVVCNRFGIVFDYKFNKSDFVVPYFMLLVVPEKHR